MECSEWLSLFFLILLSLCTGITFILMLSLVGQRGRGWSVATTRRKCITFIANRWKRIHCFMQKFSNLTGKEKYSCKLGSVFWRFEATWCYVRCFSYQGPLATESDMSYYFSVLSLVSEKSSL